MWSARSTFTACARRQTTHGPGSASIRADAGSGAVETGDGGDGHVDVRLPAKRRKVN
jgi:hypothetical protein